MKPSTLLAMAAAAVPCTLAVELDSNPLSFGAFSEPQLEKRQASVADTNGEVVISALYTIGNATQTLGDQIKTFTVANLLNLNAASLNVVKLINQGAANVSALSGNLTIEDAVLLIPVISQLAVTVADTTQAAIAQKENFGGAAFVVETQFQLQENATTTLNGVIAQKLPAALVPESLLLVAPIFANLSAGISAFAKPNVNQPSAYQSLSYYGPARNGASSSAANFGLATIAALFVAALMNLL